MRRYDVIEAGTFGTVKRLINTYKSKRLAESIARKMNEKSRGMFAPHFTVREIEVMSPRERARYR